MIFDKTGTLTEGQFGVVDITTAKGLSEEDALSLTAAVEGDGTDAELAELAGEAVGAVAGAGEDDGTAGSTDDLGGVLHPVVMLDEPEVVAGIDGVVLHRAGIVAHRIALVLAAERGDVTVEGRREQQRLPLLGGLVEDATHRRHEAHVGHTIGFVDDNDVGLAEVDDTLLDEILETAGGGDENVDALAEGLLLRSVTDAAVDGEDVAAGGPGGGGELFLDLLGEFPGGGEDQGSGLVLVSLLDTGEQR